MAQGNRYPWDFNPGLESFLLETSPQILRELGRFPWSKVPIDLAVSQREKGCRPWLSDGLVSASIGHLVGLCPKLPTILDRLRMHLHLVGQRDWASLAEVLEVDTNTTHWGPETTALRAGAGCLVDL